MVTLCNYSEPSSLNCHRGGLCSHWLHFLGSLYLQRQVGNNLLLQVGKAGSEGRGEGTTMLHADGDGAGETVGEKSIAWNLRSRTPVLANVASVVLPIFGKGYQNHKKCLWQSYSFFFPKISINFPTWRFHCSAL